VQTLVKMAHAKAAAGKNVAVTTAMPRVLHHAAQQVL
jgi:hypothetical protein